MARILRQFFEAHDGLANTAWLRWAAQTPLATLAYGLWRDEAAIRAAITEFWSQGKVEGQIHRLEPVKRSMYGGASFAVLRRRVRVA